MNPEDHVDLIERALHEDLSDIGDITSESVIPTGSNSVGNVVFRTEGVVAGLELAGLVFATVDASLEYRPLGVDGDRVASGATVARVSGSTRSILTGERTALNLLGRMSGVATATAAFVDAVAGTGAVISDTRKTIPGLRAIDKYAVTVGGGVNHRMGLYDAVMIKDNHIAAAGDIGEAVEMARGHVGPDVMVVVEVDDLAQLEQVLRTSADRVLLDNLDVSMLRKAVEVVGVEMVTEASGGISLETVREIAETGVDVISIGAITHSAPQLDIALDFAQ